LLFAAAVVASASTLRSRKLGIAEVPTSASAPPFMNPRLVVVMFFSDLNEPNYLR
jgi:hypothetical protein